MELHLKNSHVDDFIRALSRLYQHALRQNLAHVVERIESLMASVDGLIGSTAELSQDTYDRLFQFHFLSRYRKLGASQMALVLRMIEDHDGAAQEKVPSNDQ